VTTTTLPLSRHSHGKLDSVGHVMLDIEAGGIKIKKTSNKGRCLLQ
jgi:hypothetical protein